MTALTRQYIITFLVIKLGTSSLIWHFVDFKVMKEDSVLLIWQTTERKFIILKITVFWDGCHVIWKSLTCKRHMLPPSTGEKIEAVCSSDTSVNFYQMTWHCIHKFSLSS
jgi:hypothetical protein